jgi:hypothetical protein
VVLVGQNTLQTQNVAFSLPRMRPCTWFCEYLHQVWSSLNTKDISSRGRLGLDRAKILSYGLSALHAATDLAAFSVALATRHRRRRHSPIIYIIIISFPSSVLLRFRPLDGCRVDEADGSCQHSASRAPVDQQRHAHAAYDRRERDAVFAWPAQVPQSGTLGVLQPVRAAILSTSSV